MRNKNKEDSKVPKSAKTRLSDLTPKRNAPGGIVVPTPPGGGGPAPTPPVLRPPPVKKHLTL
jgi:hypothetical protein